MSVEFLRTLLSWCTIINYAILLIWFLVFLLAHDALHRLHGRWFRLNREQFDGIHYLGISVFKIGILLFNLVPLLSLWIMDALRE